MRNYEKMIDSITSLTRDIVTGFLLKILALCYPLLVDCVPGFRSAIVVQIAEEIEMKNVVKVLCGFGMPPVKLLGDTPKRFEEALQVPEYGTMVFEYSRSRYTEGNVEQLVNFCRRISLDDSAIQPLVLVITDRLMPVHIAEQFAGAVYLRELPATFFDDEDVFARTLIETVVDSQTLIRNKIQRSMIDRDSDIRVFQAASVCIESVIEWWGADEVQLSKVSDLLDEVVDDIREHWEIADDPAFFVSVFRQLFVEWIEAAGDGEVLFFERSHVEGWKSEFEKTAMFYDSGYYYLPYPLFREICKPVTTELGYAYFRDQLNLGELLDYEGKARTYGTKKIVTVNAFGEIIRMHRVKLSRRVLDEGEDFSILELVVSREGRMDYDCGESRNSSYCEQNRIYFGKSE